MRYITFALTKGRLAKKTMELLEQTGITCEEMKDPATRKLIFVNEELKLKFFLAKGPDVPTLSLIHIFYLKRLSMGTLTLDENLKPGEYRRLSEQELKELKELIS